jgi:hypothetical protein
MFEVLAVKVTGSPFLGSLGEGDQLGFGAQPPAHWTVLQSSPPPHGAHCWHVITSPLYGSVQSKLHDDDELQRL